MRISVGVLLFLTVIGCQGDPYAENYTTAKPDRAKLIGKYKLTEQTVQPGGLSVLWGTQSVIELRDDGTFVATNIPIQNTDPIPKDFFDRLVTNSGKWDIGSVGSIGYVDRPTQTHWGVELHSEGNRLGIGLTGAAAPYGLIITIGDPDAGKALMFEREK